MLLFLIILGLGLPQLGVHALSLHQLLVAPLLERMDTAGMDYRVLLLSDHKTLTATRGHDGDPVPYLIYDSREDTGRGGAYDEENGAAGPFLACGDVLLDKLFARP